MDLSRLSTADKVISVGAIVALIATFLPWYGWSSDDLFGVGGTSVSASLWDWSGGMAFVILAACIIALGVIVLRMLEVFDLSDQGVPEGIAMLAVAGIVALITIIRLISVPGGAGIVGVGRSWGLWVGVVAAAVMVVGAVLKFQEES